MDDKEFIFNKDNELVFTHKNIHFKDDPNKFICSVKENKEVFTL